MLDVKGLLYNGTELHYVWMDASNNIYRVAESMWPTEGVSHLRSWSVPYRYPPLTQALINLCSKFEVRVDCGAKGFFLGKGGTGTGTCTGSGNGNGTVTGSVFRDKYPTINCLLWRCSSFYENCIRSGI